MEPEQTAATPSLLRSRSRLRFSWLTFAALELWMWFGLSGLDYQRGRLFPFTTSGWFILGQLFTILIFVCFIRVLEMFFVRWPRVVGVLVAAGVAALIATAIYDALPRQRLNWLIGHELAKHGDIESMRVTDSFGDGEIYNGILLVDPEFVNALQSNSSFELLKRHPDEYVYPGKEGTIYRSKRAELRVVPDGNRCFFTNYFEHSAEKPLKPSL